MQRPPSGCRWFLWDLLCVSALEQSLKPDLVGLHLETCQLWQYIGTLHPQQHTAKSSFAMLDFKEDGIAGMFAVTLFGPHFQRSQNSGDWHPIERFKSQKNC